MEGPQFQMLIESLGFNCGQISVTDFVTKYEGLIYSKHLICYQIQILPQAGNPLCIWILFFAETTTSEKNEELDRQIENIEVTNILSAEDCLSQLKKKIKEYHGV